MTSLTRAEVKRLVATYPPNTRFEVLWCLPDIPADKRTWHGKVLRQRLATVDTEDHILDVEYDEMPGQKFMLPAQPWGTLDYFSIKVEGAEVFGNYAQAITSSGLGVIPYRPATWFKYTHGTDRVLGVAALMVHLDHYFSLKPHDELSAKSPAVAKERATHRDTIAGYVACVSAIDASQANSAPFRAMIEPTLLRLCQLRRGYADGVDDKNRGTVMEEVRAAWLHQRAMPSQQKFDLLMQSPIN